MYIDPPLAMPSWRRSIRQFSFAYTIYSGTRVYAPLNKDFTYFVYLISLFFLARLMYFFRSYSTRPVLHIPSDYYGRVIPRISILPFSVPALTHSNSSRYYSLSHIRKIIFSFIYPASPPTVGGAVLGVQTTIRKIQHTANRPKSSNSINSAALGPAIISPTMSEPGGKSHSKTGSPAPLIFAKTACLKCQRKR